MVIKKKKKTIQKKKIVRKAATKRKPAKKKPVKKIITKKIAKKSAAKPKRLKAGLIGLVTHYFSKVRAAVIKLNSPLTIGDEIRIKGHTTDFIQKITSMQINRVPITTAKKGDEIGLLVDYRVRGGDEVLKPQS